MLSAAALGLTAGSAGAATTAQVDAGTLRITGDLAADKVALASGLAPGSLAVDVGEDGTADFTFDGAMFTSVVVATGGGDDDVRIIGDPLAGKAVTIDGGAGADTLLGGGSAETLLGGGGDDFVDGNRGNDVAQLGGGDDRFAWDPGDGSDTVEGQAGRDRLEFHGSNASETVDVSAQGPRVRLFRDIAGITMDLADVEDLSLNALGGTDAITVGDLAGTAMKTAAFDLAGFDGAGDGQPDSVTVNGTGGDDTIVASGDGASTVVSGLAARVSVAGVEPADSVGVDGLAGQDTVRYTGTPGDDQIGVAPNGTAVAAFGATPAVVNSTAESLVVAGLAGADAITANNGIGSLTKLTIDGGDGGDTLRGGDGADLVRGGAGDDVVAGGRGADVARLGDGDDRFTWDPGDGNDSVEGQAGNDRLNFNGANVAEDIDILAGGGRLHILRNIANIAMDADVESLGLATRGGADNVLVDDLRGSGVTAVDIDLSAGTGGGDGAVDSLIVNAGNRDDVIGINRSGAQVVTSGLAAALTIAGSESTDTLLLHTFGGDDDVTVAPDVAEILQAVVDLGAGE